METYLAEELLLQQEGPAPVGLHACCQVTNVSTFQHHLHITVSKTLKAVYETLIMTMSAHFSTVCEAKKCEKQVVVTFLQLNPAQQ